MKNDIDPRLRYYNSWQEVTTLAPETGVTETSDNTETGPDHTGVPCSLVRDSFRPPATPSEMSSVEWSVSFMPQVNTRLSLVNTNHVTCNTLFSLVNTDHAT